MLIIPDEIAHILINNSNRRRFVAKRCTEKFLYENMDKLKHYTSERKGFNDSIITKYLRDDNRIKLRSLEHFLTLEQNISFKDVLDTYLKHTSPDKINWIFIEHICLVDARKIYNDYTYETCSVSIDESKCGNPEKLYSVFQSTNRSVKRYNKHITEEIYAKYNHLFTDTVKTYYTYHHGTFQEIKQIPLQNSSRAIKLILRNKKLNNGTRYYLIQRLINEPSNNRMR